MLGRPEARPSRYRGGVTGDDMTLGEAGEIEAIRRITRRLPPAEAAELGPGDDSAVLRAPDGRFTVSTDLLIHGPDFRLAWSTPYDIGWKAAATNLADAAAMGARPTALVVALAAPLSTPLGVLEGISDGLRDGCAALSPGVGVVGGDLSASATLTLAVTVFGDLGGHPPVTRGGARPGDTLAVSGALGRAAAGLALLFRDGVDSVRVPDAEAAQVLRERHGPLLDAQLRPSPPIGDGVVAAIGRATAMLDVSDGILLDAGRIAAASGVRLDIASSALAPDLAALADPTLGFDDDRRLRLVLAGGEDHALLAAFPPGAVPAGFRAIGRVETGQGVTLDGVAVDGRAGWDPFEDWDGLAG